ncbi:MAG: hypothetical protein KDB32_06790 [Planctomycetes bacterium]|nr:hypothetical protein [Planctomycetota bacterium]
MNLLERIKLMFSGSTGDAEMVIKNANSTREMLEHLDELITQNEVELRKTRQELARLELSERASIENIKTGRVGDREKEFVLLQIKRTRTHMGNLKLKADILNKNIELHMNLVGKIQAMEAMDLRGIEQSVVERVMLDFEEGMDKFRESVQTGDGVVQNRDEVLSNKDKEDLRKLEKEIMGEETRQRQRTTDEDLREIEEEIMRREEKRDEAEAKSQAPKTNEEPEAQVE